MKIELEIDAEKLELLDGNLTDLLSNLSAEQKTDIIKSYLLHQFDKWESTSITTWGEKKTTLSTFANHVIAGLKDAIRQEIFTEVLQDPSFIEQIDALSKEARRDLPNIIREAICSYVTDNLFANRNTVRDQIYEQLNYHCNSYHNRY